MTTSLKEAVADPATADAIAKDLAGVVDAEVSDKKGLSGTALRTAFGAAKKVKPQLVERATATLLPEFASALDPLWSSKPEGTSFGAHLSANSDVASDALLSITDAQSQSAPQALQKVYGSLRGKAKDNVIEALPRVGDVFDKHVH